MWYERPTREKKEEKVYGMFRSRTYPTIQWSYIWGGESMISSERTYEVPLLAAHTASSWPKSSLMIITFSLFRRPCRFQAASMPPQLKIRHNKSQREVRANRATRVLFECTSCYTECSTENDSINRRHHRVQPGHPCSRVAICGHTFNKKAYAKTINSTGKKWRWRAYR